MNERTAAEAKTDESKAFNRLVIDLMLAHIPSGISETERIYNRAAYLMPMLRRAHVVIETFERWRQPRAPPHGIASTGTTTS